MNAARNAQRSALRLVSSNTSPTVWFCSHCGSYHYPSSEAELPRRVCPDCLFGVLLQTRADSAPGTGKAFLVVDSTLAIQAVSQEAEGSLGLSETQAINRHVTELLISADVESGPRHGLAEAITRAAGGDEEPTTVSVRPSGVFGIRLQARIAACGPPAAALLVLE